jgi:DNA-binding CsgD family transcriptional regulator
VSGVVVLVVFGLARGVWLSNLHNGLLALAFTFVGAYVLFQRPGHREGLLMMAAGVVESVLFLGRQIGHIAGANELLGWLGVWPVAIAIALVSLAVICFPDGRLPSPRWRLPVAVAVTVAGACAVLSALWPVEYGSTGVVTGHPLDLGGLGVVTAVWEPLAHTTYAGLQLSWVLAVVVRWRSSQRLVRVQLTWVGLAVALSALLLVIGLVVAGSPRLGLLSAALVPVAAGWAIVHGQHLSAYSALSWFSRAGRGSDDMAADLARAVAEALGAPRASLWMGPDTALHAVGEWPESFDGAGPVALEELRDQPDVLVRPVTRGDAVIGAISVVRPGAGRLSRPEEKLLNDLGAQAELVIEHLTLVRDGARQRATGDLSQLSLRERQVLELMARGLSNSAICQQLHLSIKTVEPVVSSIFTKLGLSQHSGSNRRVLAVLAFLEVNAPDRLP